METPSDKVRTHLLAAIILKYSPEKEELFRNFISACRINWQMGSYLDFECDIWCNKDICLVCKNRWIGSRRILLCCPSCKDKLNSKSQQLKSNHFLFYKNLLHIIYHLPIDNQQELMHNIHKYAK